jgi:hypothetical protein
VERDAQAMPPLHALANDIDLVADGTAGHMDIADHDATAAHVIGEVPAPLPTEDRHFVHEFLRGTAYPSVLVGQRFCSPHDCMSSSMTAASAHASLLNLL